MTIIIEIIIGLCDTRSRQIYSRLDSIASKTKVIFFASVKTKRSERFVM